MSEPRIERRRVDPDAPPLGALHPVVQRVLRARGVSSLDELDVSLNGLLRADALGGIARATELLADAIRDDRRIVIVADFDADGATSCAVALRGLRACGARHVDYVVPNRFEYGYGLTPPIVDLVREKRGEVLVTVDNGISSLEGVAAARSAGLTVLVTDHHLPGAELPAADAIVNPNVAGDAFPSKSLAGVGVMFYVLLALRAHLRDSGWFGARALPEPNLAELLDLVALGTVADVVPLDANNRRLVAQGLSRIRAGRAKPGILALLTVAGRDPRRALASDLGFAVGPRLNAAGRLADMSLGIELLLCDDAAIARRLAQQLDELNRARREIERDMKEQAQAIVAGLDVDGAAGLPPGLCLFDESWHQGVIGIVASRIKDLHHRPTIAFARADAQELKGSARSIPGVHVRDVLDAVAASHPRLLGRFGGHAMAAGLALRAEDLPRFEAAFAAEVGRRVDASVLERVIASDGELGAGDFTLSLAQSLASVAPWGQGFPEPLFDGVFRIRERRIVGEHHLRLQLEVPGGGTLAAIAFNQAAAAWAPGATAVHAAYRLTVNEWQSVESVQLVIEHATQA